MTESRKIVLHETAVIAMGEIVCVGLMCAIYGLIGKFSWQVLLSGCIGGLLALGNFFFLAVAATLAADKAVAQDAAGGKKLIRGSYVLRLLVLAVLLFLCGKSGVVNVVALVVPLLFTRPILTLTQFFRKSGEENS